MTTATNYKADLGFDILKIAIHGGLENGKLDILFSLEPENFNKLAFREIFVEAQGIYRAGLPVTTATLIHRLGKRFAGRPLLENITGLLLEMEAEKAEAEYLSGHVESYIKQLKERKFTETAFSNNSQQEVFNCTDLGNSKRLVSQFGDKFRYCFAWKKWLVWDGKSWHIDDNGQMLRLAKDTVKRVYEEAGLISDESQRKAVAKWAVSSESEHRINAMVSLAESEPSIPVSPQELDTNSYLLNCLNGTIDLTTGELKPHESKDFITKIIPTEYNQEATSPLWTDFLETIFNWNYDLIRFIQRAVGYSLTGDVSEQCIFLLHGIGSNGKSTFVDVVSMLLGDYSQGADFETFLIRRNETIRNDLARMTGKRFISAIESEGERRLAEVLVKQLTGGDTITARFLFSEFFDFKPTFKIWLVANHKPIIRGTDYAIWRRIKLIPFNIIIPEGRRIPKSKLIERFSKEFPGILTWMVTGCLEWQKNGLQTPAEVKSATSVYREEMDTIGAFISENCILTPEVKAKASDLYEVYKEWCAAGGEYALSQRSFGLRLAERGLERIKSGGNFWKGIGIKTEK